MSPATISCSSFRPSSRPLSLRRQRFIAAALVWENTPYHMNQCQLGLGVDCINVPIAAARDAGLPFVPHEVPPEYRGYSGRPAGRTLKLILDKYLYEMSRDVRLPGDLILFKLREDPQHLAILVSDTQILHAAAVDPMNRRGRRRGRVKISDMTWKWEERIVQVYRIPGIDEVAA